ncbi:hypothetical protein SEVIR_9G482601v4 [Setaria viridis]
MISTFSPPRRTHGQRGWRCWSHRILGSRMSTWCTKTKRVITLEGGLLGWVDLWRIISGVVFCCAAFLTPILSCVTSDFPSRWMVTCACTASTYKSEFPQTARPFRDVTFSDGFIKLIEVEHRRRLVATVRPAMLDSVLEIENGMGACTTGSYTPYGWTTVTWNRKLSSDRWRQDCTAYISTSSILPHLRHNHSEGSVLENLEMAGPLWTTLHGGWGEEGCCCKGAAARERKGDASRGEKNGAAASAALHGKGAVAAEGAAPPQSVFLHRREPCPHRRPHLHGVSFHQRLQVAGAKALVVARCLIHGCILNLWIRQHGKNSFPISLSLL